MMCWRQNRSARIGSQRSLFVVLIEVSCYPRSIVVSGLAPHPAVRHVDDCVCCAWCLYSAYVDEGD